MKPSMEHGHNPHACHGDADGESPNRRSRLKEINIPTLVIHGTEDAILPLDHGQAIADGIQNAEMMIMEGVGHELPEELNDEVISRLVEHFKKA